MMDSRPNASQKTSSDGEVAFGGGLLQEPIAIVSLSCKLPGADNVDEFWDLLISGRSAIGRLPEEIINRDLYFDPTRTKRCTSYSDVGAVVNRDDSYLQILGMTKEEAAEWDVCHLQFATVAFDAWQQSFKKPSGVDGGRCGVYVGHSGGTNSSELIYSTLSPATASYLSECETFQNLPSAIQDQLQLSFQQNMQNGRPRKPEGHWPNWDVNDIARLVSKVTQTNGPQVAIESACASSSVALCMAGLALNANQIDVAIIGGASYNKSDSLILFSQAQSCSGTDSRPFDDDADGLISSEGFVVVIAKRLADAIRDNDTIHGVITGAGMASDGKGKSLWAPRREGQIESMRRAYRDAEHAAKVQYIEAHATSTQVGDATETGALAEFFGQFPRSVKLPIGSVKSNLGHTLESAGLVGLVKTILAMRNQMIPPSINFQKPNQQIVWNEVPFEVATEPKRWLIPKHELTRIAAVNAFGIGGLNVHLVVEQFHPRVHSAIASPRIEKRSNHEPIAIVGMGCVLPGASNVQVFQQLLQDRRSWIQSPPVSRWPQSLPQSFGDAKGRSSCRVRAGYIEEFQYDWRTNRIPPKQVDHANPLQFMLLQAAGESLAQTQSSGVALTSNRVGVIVGSIFGGEFGNGLQVGLRLQQVQADLEKAIRKLGLSSQEMASLQAEMEAQMLKHLPAMQDETGSFTSSTLASRITKHYNLMGGAFAVDGADQSAVRSIDFGMQMLRSGSVDAIICASGSRALDYFAFARLHAQGRLPTNHSDEEIYPGEGVVAFTLQRLSDAISQNRQILGVLDEVEFHTEPQEHASEAATKLLALEQRIGRIGGTEAMVGIAASLADRNAASDHAEQSLVINHRDHVSSVIHFRSGAPTSTAIKQIVQSATQSKSPDLSIKLNSMQRLPGTDTSIERRSARSSQERQFELIGCLPGQGLQGKELLNESLLNTECARAVIADANQVLVDIGGNDFGSYLTKQPASTFEKIWASQLVTLVSTVAVAENFAQSGVRFDALIGHSLGELSAFVVAQSWSLSTAIQFLFHRAKAVEKATQNCDSGLLSISADRKTTQDLLTSQLSTLRITHQNSANQIVVGGSLADLSIMLDHCRRERIACVMLNVPAAYHSPIMESARWALVDAVRELPLLPPVIPILSTVTGKFVSDPDAIRQNLLDQLVTPINYPREIERLLSLGASQFVEIGPGKVLTKLNQATAKEAKVSSADEFLAQIEQSDLRVGTSDANQSIETARFSNSKDIRQKPSQSAPIAKAKTRRLIDATATRRAEMRQRSELAPLKPLQVTDAAQIELQGPRDHEVLETSQQPSKALEPQVSREQLQQFVVDFIVEHTGYPLEMIDPTWDLEAELGVDSIKQAQLFGELRQTFDLDPSKFRDVQVRSISDICDVLLQNANHADNHATLNQSNEHKTISASHHAPQIYPASEPEFSQTTQSASLIRSTQEPEVELEKSNMPLSAEVLNAFMIDFVVEHTGYPREMVDLNADFESELGLDSIKLAQLVGEMRSSFDLELTQEDRRSFLQCKTLADIGSFLVAKSLSDDVATQDASAPVDSTTVAQPFVSTNARPANAPLVASRADHKKKESATPIASIASDYSRSFSSTAESSSRASAKAFRREYQVASVIQASEAVLRSRQAAAIANRFEVQERFLKDTMRKGCTNCNTQDSLVQTDECSTTRRFVLRMQKNPIEGDVPAARFSGRAVVVGDNSIARELIHCLRKQGVPALQLVSNSSQSWVTQLEREWKSGPLSHLFITTPHDTDASVSKRSGWWPERSVVAVDALFWLCQKWYQLVNESSLLQEATFVGTPNLGGGFGFESKVNAIEGGVIAGLMKALMIECWMAGNRRLNFKLVDLAPSLTPATCVDAILTELSYGSYDTEIGYDPAGRKVVRAVPQRPGKRAAIQPERDSVWICTGGARGITAFVAESLAHRYRLKLNLVGTTPLMEIPAEWRTYDETQMRSLKLSVMQQARDNPVRYGNLNPLKAWQNVEKAIEIDGTLRRLRSKGHTVEYHACDCSDPQAVAKVVADIEQKQGKIAGILHGAGIGQDSRFDRKLPQKVKQCFAAKLDGSLALLNAVDLESLKYFIAFGSISGRFGANGHTDYSASNEGLIKICDWMRTNQPNVRTIGFHWHAWGDVGMATKPETRLALESVGMQFMPAEEGLRHLIDEIEHTSHDSEILITDDRYYRAFYPAESVEEAPQALTFALLDESSWRLDTKQKSKKYSASGKLDPLKDPFLIEHRLNNRPLLPVVVDVEYLGEAALLYEKNSPGRDAESSHKGGTRRWSPISFQNLKVHAPLKFFCDNQHAVQVFVEPKANAGELHVSLYADALNRAGLVVGKDKLLCDAVVQVHQRTADNDRIDVPALDRERWHQPKFSEPTDMFYSGPPFRLMPRFSLTKGAILAELIAPSLVELAGIHRTANGWQLPSALLDASLYASGIVSWHEVRPAVCLPTAFDQLHFLKLPRPGQKLLVHSRLTNVTDRIVCFDFDVIDSSGRIYIAAKGYQATFVS